VESTRELLTSAAARLAAAGVPTPDVDAELLLAHVTGRQRALLRMAGGSVTDEQSASYAALVARRAERIPLQHLTGVAPFRHLELHVGPGVFVPRPETELMVDHVRDFAAHRRGPRDGTGSRGIPVAPPQPGGDPGAAAGAPLVVDLCSGSGALALAIATELPGSRVIAVELSPEAAAWARRNIAGHAQQVTAAGSVLELLEADATRVAAPGGPLGGLRGTVDVVVTNPPYVPDAAIPREPEVRDHDPSIALYGGPDGLDIVRPLAEQAALLLRPGGLLLVEHADVQGDDAGESGVPRVLRSQREPAAPEPAGNEPSRPAGDPGGGDPTNPEPDPRSTPAWAHVTDHLDLAGRPRHTAAIRAPGRMAP
jgi:release factor glutamine methyltransferase